MSSNESNKRLEQISQFVQKYLQKKAKERANPSLKPDYRWEHTLRVTNYGKTIAKAEKANIEFVIAACLLHDVATYDEGERKDHGRLGAEICRPMLLEIGYSPEETENICYSVASHVDIQNPETFEAKIVTDADNIDRFGAFRVILWCIDDMDNYPALITKLTERVQRLENYRQQRLMETQTGHIMFNEQLDLQINFFKALIKEKTLTVFPTIEE